ncbi:V-type ATP synthase subunit I, partial [Candidatus Parvarchaeota archaeon]|nr:V-type ATP synthase subunit I [Candidatus Parvarchaeota archaeon]
MSERSLLMVAKVIIPGSIIAMGLGVIFNEYFGFALPYNALFNVTKNVGTLLLLSGWIGVGMVSFGFVLGAINKILVRDLKGAAGRIGWLMAAWGIVILGLDILSKENIGP